MTEMEIKVEVEAKEILNERNIKSGWYKAKFNSKEYNRIICVKRDYVYDEIHYYVLGASDVIQDLTNGFSFYTDWKPIEKITMEVE